MYKKEIIEEMKTFFGDDKERIDHSLQVTDYAEKLIDKYKEKSSNLKSFNREIIIYSAILHDVGIKIAEEKYNSAAGKYQEIEGPSVAREILQKYPVEDSAIEEICDIIAHHHSPGKIDTLNFKLLYDADWLVNLPVEVNLTGDRQKAKTAIDKVYLTTVGQKLATELFL